MDTLIRALAATVLAIHGLIHLIGFVVPWRIATMEGFAYRTSVLDGAADIGDPGARLLGVIWLGLALGFGVAAYGIWRGRRWGLPAVATLAIVSLVVCVLGLPETAAGVALDVVILAGVVGHTVLTRRAPRAT